MKKTIMIMFLVSLCFVFCSCGTTPTQDKSSETETPMQKGEPEVTSSPSKADQMYEKYSGIIDALEAENYQSELLEATNAYTVLGLSLEEIYHFNLPNELGHRSILVFKKIKETPSKYPRRYATILKQPL